MYALKTYINKFILKKFLLGIEKAVKTSLIFNKFFFKNDILLCILKTHVSKIFIII